MSETDDGRPRFSVSFQLLRDLAAGKVSAAETARFYEAAADAATRDPEIGRTVEAVADRRLAGRGGRSA